MCPGFPDSDYYGPSAPFRRHQLTVHLPAATLDGCPDGRPRNGSRVHHAPVGGIGAQLFPCSLATGTPQTFPVPHRDDVASRRGFAHSHQSVRACCCPAHIHQVGAGSTLEGVQPLVHSRYASPPRLPDPGRLVVPTRPVVVRAASRPPLHLQRRTALSYTDLPRQTGGGSLHPTWTHGASRRTATT